MKLFRIFGISIIAMLTLYSCTDSILKPKDNQIDRLKWSYDFETVMALSNINFVPAIDENGNIYAVAEVQAGSQIVKLNANGDEMWSKVIPPIIGRLIYFDSKIFYNQSGTLVCADASTGTEIWRTDNAMTFDIFAITDNKIYTTLFVDDGFLGKNYLNAFDHQGNKIWEERIKYSDTDTTNFPYTISVRDNQIYLGVLAEVGNSEFAIINYQDDGASVSRNWNWLAPASFSVGNSAKIHDIAIEDNNDLLFGMESDGIQYVFSVNSSGIENWSNRSSLSHKISNLTTDGSGNAYVAYDICEKIGKDGTVWSSEIKTDWDYEGKLSNSPAISQNKTLYYQNTSKILTALNSDGEFLWEQYYEPTDGIDNEFHNITINKNGDIIVITKVGILCFEGDGSGLSTTGWPKKYGNYGNTSSKLK